MTTRLVRLKRRAIALSFTALLVPGVAYAQSPPEAKFDKSLRTSMKRGCVGTKSVIIRTTPGAREALRKSLTAQGRKVKGEFPAIDALTVDLSCADLKAVAGSAKPRQCRTT